MKQGNRICRTITPLFRTRQDPVAVEGLGGPSRGGGFRGSARLGNRALVAVRAVAAGLLGAVQRRVGRLDEILGLLDPVVDREGGDARGDRDANRVGSSWADEVVPRRGAPHPVGQALSLHAGRLGEEGGELFTSRTGDQI